MLKIFDLAALGPDQAERLVRATIAAHPTLGRIYDDAFIASLIRRRQDNALLLRLARPDDEMTVAYWNAVCDDLLALDDVGGFKVFRAKLQLQRAHDFEIARTELFFAAWVSRHGISLELEPTVGSGKCEFRTISSPETWWEIKTPSDLADTQVEGTVDFEIQRRLRVINEPFVLVVASHDITPEHVPAAVKDLKRQIYAYHKAGGIPPHEFSAGGIVIRTEAMTDGRKGYIGALAGQLHEFENENSSRVTDRLGEAAGQIPRSGGGIVVIDRSFSDSIDDDDVLDACFGELSTTFINGAITDFRKDAWFDRGSAAKISAVISYTRRWRNSDDPLMVVLHNPNALVPLPRLFIASRDIRHIRRLNVGNGYRFGTTNHLASEE